MRIVDPASRVNSHRLVRVLAACGVAAPVVFTAAVLILGVLHPSYDHASQQISELGAEGALNAAVMNVVGFGLTGALTVGFGFGLRLGVGKARDSLLGALLVGLGGLGMIAIGIFECEPGCELTSSKAMQHSLAASLTILGTLLAEFAFFSTFRKAPYWRGFAGYSLISGFLSLVLAPTFILTYLSGLDRWVGVSERALAATGLIWMTTVGFHLYRRETSLLPQSARPY